MAAEVLSDRALNRATLARQALLERASTPILDMVAHLVGLQAQIPLNPYLALWSRLEGFQPDELGQLVLDRRLVRIVAMRATIHLLTVDDALVLRPLAQPVLDAELARHPDHGPPLAGVDLAPIMDVAAGLLAPRPLTGAQLRAAIAERFPELDAAAVAYACRNRLALVQVPPRGVWGRTGQVSLTTLESWVGRPLAAPSVADVVSRYLGAFGPASVADVSTWCRLTGLREVIERLRPQLREFRDSRGRELFDLPDAPRPDSDVPAPVRFLPEYDNLVLSHADRSRFITPDVRSRLFASTRSVRGTALHDGMVTATWHVRRDPLGAPPTLVVDPAGKLSTRARSAIASEGRRALGFLAPDAGAPNNRRVEVAGGRVS